MPDIPKTCTRCAKPLYHAGKNITSPSSVTWLCEKCSNSPVKAKTFNERRVERDKIKYTDLTQEQILEGNFKVELVSAIRNEFEKFQRNIENILKEA